MALPFFSKVGMTDLVFPRGNAFQDDYTTTPNQIVGYTEAGIVRVASMGVPEVLLPLSFPNVPLATWAAVLAWLNDVLINWAANTFIYTDVESVAWTVRCINASLTRPRVTVGLCDVSLTLRQEIV